MATPIEQRLEDLETHLKTEDPTLHDVVKIFRELDEVAYDLGILDEDESYATRVSWWPMISILGTFSAGKSTFINDYLGADLQRTGNQAVDDKFTVISYSEKESNTLPGIALDADPRFPFYQISRDISEITSNGGQRIDAYLQIKTSSSDVLSGKIFIDSPGFDADSQRTETLRITKHIIDLSDLVLVFFDARHPEPGAMHDTLQHLVTETIDRPDSNKFMYILNQIDITAREDNLEEVVAAWQRSLAQAGLTAGRFYRVFNPSVAVPMENDKVRERMEAKSAEDMKDIRDRIDQVSIERAYRITGALEHTAKDIEHRLVPQIEGLIQRWKSRTFRWDVISLVIIAAIVGIGCYTMNVLEKVDLSTTAMGIIGVIVALMVHFKVSSSVARNILDSLNYEIADEYSREALMRAFKKNTTFDRTLFMPFISTPVGWGTTMRRKVHGILSDINTYVRTLNDRFTSPSGRASNGDEEVKG